MSKFPSVLRNSKDAPSHENNDLLVHKMFTRKGNEASNVYTKGKRSVDERVDNDC